MRSETATRPDRPAAGPASARSARQAARARYRDNLARHLIGISRDLQARVRSALGEEGGYAGLRPSFGPLLSLVWKQGRPLGAIARELGISDQACGQLVNLVESAGYLERRPNPEDGRSKLVSLTPRGDALVQEGVRIILATETDYAAQAGAADYSRFTTSLAALYRGLGIPTHADPSLTAAAGRSVGVLPLIAERIQQELMQATIARGHAGLKMSHGQVLPLIGPDGGRIFEIARVQRVSRQAISATSRDLERLGYLEREPDPRDRRGVVLRLTGRGVRLIGDSVVALDGLEARFVEILGERSLAHLRDVARRLYQALRLEAEIFEPGAAAQEAAPGASKRRVARSGSEIQQIATRLRRRLGSRDAARLAELLEPRAERRQR